MAKEAKSLITKNNNQTSDKVIVGGAMMNSEKEAIRLYKTHNWARKFTKEPSGHIIMGQPPGTFVHQGELYARPPPNTQSMFYGSSGAVLYGNYVLDNQQGQSNHGQPIYRGWLLAWSILDNDHHVYVNSGSLDEMMKKLNWEEVCEKLRKAGTTSYHWDPDTGAEASATITPMAIWLRLAPSLASTSSLLSPNQSIKQTPDSKSPVST